MIYKFVICPLIYYYDFNILLSSFFFIYFFFFFLFPPFSLNFFSFSFFFLFFFYCLFYLFSFFDRNITRKGSQDHRNSLSFLGRALPWLLPARPTKKLAAKALLMCCSWREEPPCWSIFTVLCKPRGYNNPIIYVNAKHLTGRTKYLHIYIYRINCSASLDYVWHNSSWVSPQLFIERDNILGMYMHKEL